MHHKMLIVATLAFLLMLTGCGATPFAPAPARTPVIFRGDGSPATLGEINAAARAAQAVFIGENHGHPLGLATAATIWNDLIANAPSAALAMEFFERDEQAALDDYLADITDSTAFAKAANRTPSNYPDGHRDMVVAAKVAHRPVIAANAPRRYVRLARTEGFGRLTGLSPEQARLFRVPDALPTGRYYDNFVKVMGGAPSSPQAQPAHAGAPAPKPADNPADLAERKARIDASFRSQSVWDWTMAESVARSINTGATPTVLVIGRFHIDHQGGTLLALQQLRPQTSVVTISFIDGWSDTPNTINAEDKDRADFVIYVGPATE